MTDAPFTPAHREKLERFLAALPPPTSTTKQGELEIALRAALAEIARLTAENERLQQERLPSELSRVETNYDLLTIKLDAALAEIARLTEENEVLQQARAKALDEAIAVVRADLPEEALCNLLALRSAPDLGGEK